MPLKDPVALREYKAQWKRKNSTKTAESEARYRDKHREKISQRNAKWRAENIERWRESHRKAEKLRKERIRESIAGRPRPDTCEVCFKKGVIRWDHCHATGKFRGWICAKCNNALGMVGDSIDVLKALIAYLSGHKNDSTN